MPFPSFPHSTLHPFREESKHLRTNKRGRPRNTGLSLLERHLNLTGNWLKKWMEKGLQSPENALCPSERRLPPLLWRPGHVKARSQASENHKPWRPSLALPGLYLFLGVVVPSLLTEKGRRFPNARSGSTEQGGGRAVGLLTSEGSRSPAPASCSGITDAGRKTPHRRAVADDSDADTWCAGEHLGPPSTGTHLMCHVPQALSPASSPFLPHRRVRVSGSLQWQWQEEEAGSSWGPLLLQVMAPPGVPLSHACTQGQAMRVQARCLPAQASARDKNLGFPSLPGSLFSWIPFLKVRIFTITMKSSMIMRMPSLLFMCPLTRRLCSSFVS